ncbi:calmodulin-binding receptor-like cytoplasmic kinase 2 [Curcuma longa]|uniref:calmodulin-binding receptor-like cytoplasmic kinase 2 n=1 Tax=Curcuma longa TaxID=136217 RepID=UPI003D9E13AE
MQSPAKSLASQSPIDGRRKSCGDSCDVASRSSGSSITSSSSSSRNPLAIAARAISACFITPEDRSPPSSDNFSEDPSATTQESNQASSQVCMRQGMGIHTGGRSEPSGMRLTMSDITKATKNFSPSLKIGQGGSGTVYKAKLGHDTVVAIKRVKKNGYQSHLRTEFHNEIQTLAQIEHQNLVRLHGFLEDQDERIIVVEYVTNGTLREHLDCQRGKVLELSSRLDVAIDVAHAITYLHMYSGWNLPLHAL